MFSAGTVYSKGVEVPKAASGSFTFESEEPVSFVTVFAAYGGVDPTMLSATLWAYSDAGMTDLVGVGGVVLGADASTSISAAKYFKITYSNLSSVSAAGLQFDIFGAKY